MKLCIHLSGVWTDAAERSAADADRRYRAPGLPSDSALDWHVLDHDEAELKERLADAVASILPADGDRRRSAPLCDIVNDYVDYALLPVAKTLAAVSKAIETEKIDEIDLWTATTTTRFAPLFGVDNKEDHRGSPHLQGAFAAQLIARAGAGATCRLHPLRGDWWCRDGLRRPALRGVSFALAVLNALRMTFGGIRPVETADDPQRSVLIVARGHGQLEHARRLADRMPSASILKIPQLTLSLRREAGGADADRSRMRRPGNGTILRGLGRMLRPVRYPDETSATTVRYGEFELPVSCEGMAREVSLLPMLRYHERLVGDSLARSGTTRAVNFEIKGVMGGVEARAARGAGATMDSVQTVLVQKTPMAIFPFCDRFHADSEKTRTMIMENGRLAFGSVVYSGSIYEKSDAAGSSIRKILFFSQPYEYEAGKDFLSALIACAARRSLSVAIRLHPRDSAEHYAEIVEASNGVATILPFNGLQDDIAAADLCVTRVSSVAKDVLAVGKPILFGLWSEADRAVAADYIDPHLAPETIATDAAELEARLDDPDALHAAARRLRASLYDERDLGDLARTLEA